MSSYTTRPFRNAPIAPSCSLTWAWISSSIWCQSS
jgi:hypothetical protein